MWAICWSLKPENMAQEANSSLFIGIIRRRSSLLEAFRTTPPTASPEFLSTSPSRRSSCQPYPHNLMKSHILSMLAVFHWLATFTAHSQGTIIYDQQSSTNSLSFGAGVSIQQNGPLGQSLTPNLSSVGFVQLILNDGNINDGLGATLLVNLRAD